MTAPLAVRHELARKALHLGAAVVPLSYRAGAPRDALALILAAALLVALLVEIARVRRPSVQGALDRMVGPLFRHHERARLTGATWLAVALLVALMLLPPPLAIATMWAAAVADPAAALVGRTIGRIRPRPGAKSLEGALACFAVAALGAWLVAGLPPSWALAAGIAAAAAEWPTVSLDDNIRVSLGVGLTLAALRMFAN